MALCPLPARHGFRLDRQGAELAAANARPSTVDLCTEYGERSGAAKMGREIGTETMAGRIGVGIGGWTFEPWRGTFYPPGLAQKRELEFASRALTAIEINGTYYSTFKPQNWRTWHDATPDDFIFSVKASRYATNRKVLADAGPAIDKFLGQGLTELGPKLGPILWQFMATKRFDPDDFSAFLALLPKSQDGIALRHALEVRHPSFETPAFIKLAQAHGAAIVFATGKDYPTLSAKSGGFTYARIMSSDETHKNGFSNKAIAELAQRVNAWTRGGDVFLFFIGGAKVRNPAAAAALIAKLGKA